jgi:hypothetical protein
MQRHRHQEFIRFLGAIEAAVPAGKLVHAIMDNYAVHKHPKVRAWLERHPRWTFHFTPTSCSWLNAVEGFFATLTKRRLKRGSFSSLVDLQAAINRYLAQANQDPRPFVWTAEPDSIIQKVRRGYQASQSLHSHVPFQGLGYEYSSPDQFGSKLSDQRSRMTRGGVKDDGRANSDTRVGYRRTMFRLGAASF